MAIDRYELYKQMKAEEAKPKEQKKQDKEKDRYEQYKAAKGYVSTPDVKDDPYQAYANRANQTIGQVVGNLSNSAIWRDPKALTDLQQKARMENLDRYNLQMQGLKEGVDVSGLSGAAKFYTEADQALDARSKYYAQFGSKNQFVSNQIDGMDKRQVREPSAPMGKADILPKNTNDYLRFQSDQMMGAGPQTIGTNPIAEMMEKQKFFQQTAHDPKALQFAKFTGEYDQMGRDGRLGFESAAIEAERKDINKRRSELENSYNEALARLYSGSLSSDEYDKQDIIAGEWADKLNAIDAENRLSMLDSMQGQVESTQRWNATKDKYAPYLYAEDFEQNSKYNLNIPEGEADKFLKRPDNFGASYEYAYVNEPEMFKDSPLMNDSREFMDYLSDDERKVYNYIYNTKGNEAANQMLDDMREQLSARRSYEHEKGAAAYAKEYPVLSFLNARGQNFMKSSIAPLQLVAALTGAGKDDPIFDVNRITETIDSTNAQELSKAMGKARIPFIDADAGEVVYGILSSGADALAAMGVSKLLLGKSAASGRMIQGIMSTGAASSAMKSAVDRGLEPWKVAVMGLMGGAIEAVTEKYSIDALFNATDRRAWAFFLKNVFTEGSEEFASSALNRITDGIMNADKGEIAQRAIEIARTSGIPQPEALKQARMEWLQQAGVEFISGAVMGGVFAGPKALSFARSDAKANKPATVTDQIANKEAEIAKKESEAYENAARERMDFETRDGEAAKQYAELVTLVNESFPEESETRAKIAEATTIDTKRMTEIATGAMQELRARMQAEASPEVLKLSEALTQTVEGIFAGMQTDRNAITDKYTAGLDEGLKAEIKGKNDVSYAKGYGIAHALGAIGVPVDTIAKVKSVSSLQETAKQAAQQGQAKWEAALPTLKTKAADLQKTLPKPGQGGVTYRANVKQEALSTLQRDQIGLLEKIAKPLGYNFVMMEFDKDAQGNYVTDKGQIAPNGFFRDSDGTIYIDVNAGKTAGRMVDDTIIPLTAGHELGHYLKAASPELFRAYSAAVVDELVSKGTDIDALIAKQIGRGKLREITVESAIEEMIMESGAMILSNSQAAQKMAETNPGLFQKIAEWVKDFVDSIRKAFSRVDATPEAKAIMQTVNGALKYSDTIINLWDTMAVTEAKGRADVKPATVARRDVQAVAQEAATKKTAYTSDGQAVDYHYEIAPVGSLIPSNLETSLEPNPDYPQELQPRDRTRAASQQQVEEIANKLNPALLGESADVGTGAPFVGPDMVVESGNGRILAITRAMRQGKGLTYTQWLKDNAARFGIDPAKVDNASVLVRVRDTEVNRPEFVQKANESQVATYSDSESAVSDAKKVTPAMLEMANMDSGDINSAGNSGFVSSFISKVVPVAERGRMMDAKGKLSKSGENRVRTALFQMAYEDGYLTEQMAEASDDTSKNILKAMTAVAPRLALMNDAMKKGTLSDYPIGQAIAEAYRIVQRQKRLGVSVDRYINQQSLVRQDTPAHWMLLEMFNENRKAPNRMTDALNSILNAAERQGNPNQMLMPGLEADRPSVEGIVRDGLNRYADEGMAASERDTLKFQMRTPVEETAKLIAVHNLSEAQLLSSVELGGFAMPSIAVIRAGQPHDRYGDISIVFGKETIDPKNSENKVYGGDAWTPSFPNIDYEISETAAQAVRKKASELLGPYYKDMRPGLDDDNMQDVINRAGGDPVKAYEDNNALKAAYLRDIGENFTPRYSEPDYGSEFGNDVVKYVADRMGDKVKEALSGDRKQFMSIEPDVRKALNERDNGKFGGDVYSQPFGFGQVDRLARAVAQYMNSNGATRFDVAETSRDIREAMKEGNHEAGYKAWLKNLFGGIVSKSGIRNNAEFFTPSGNRRSFDALHWSVTLENVVRSMKSQDGKGVDSMGGGGLFGVSTKNYNSLDDIRKDVDRLQLMDEEQYQTKKDEFRDRIIELADEIAPKSERNRFTALDRASEVLTEAARKGTTAGIQRVLNGYKDYYNIREDTAKKLYKLMSDISRMPTEYFEAKPERAVGFDEVRAVIIPDTASDALKKALDNVSAPVIEYKADDNADRLKALNSPELDGVKFQERDAQYLAAVESGDMDTAQKMVDEAAKEAGYEVGPVYHGTSAKFNTFRRGDIGFHFGTKSQARTRSGYGRNAVVISANLNMQNPLRVSNDYGSWDADYAAKWMLGDGHITQGEYREIMNTPSSKQNKAMRELLIRKGYDGVEYVNQFEGRSPKPSYIVFLSSQAKRTDPVTYDDSGNVIPLSKRFTDSDDIRYQERDPDYRTKRDILAGAFDSVAETEVEKRNLKEYKNLIGSLNRMEEEARGLRLANSAEWKKPEPDRAKVNENKKRIFEIEKRIFSMDKKLIQMQNAAPLRNVLLRQKKAYERKAVEKYKGKRDTNELNDALDLRADRAAKRLMKYALTPDKNSHVPDGMRTDITNLLTALDLASEDKAGNTRDSYRARSWQEALTALGIRMKNADMVAATTKGNDEAGPALLVDPALQDKIESLIKRNDGVVRYRNLKTKEKQTVVEILESVSVAVSEANKKFSADRTKTISDVADKTIDYAKAQREKKLRGEIAERLSTFLNIDMADAFTFFDSLGEGGQEILKGLYNEGFSKLVRNTEEARAFFDGLNAKYGKYGMSTWGGKNATTKNFKVASGTLTMTPAQIMELYMLNKREQARGHIYGQGIRVERIRSRKPGKAAVLWQKDALTVTPAEIEAITSTLTEQQKQVAEEFGAFFGRTSTKWGNEVSMTLYGYYKFIEQNYYPIHSDTNFTMTQDPNSADMLYALLNIGATKDTVKFANNPIIISDIFDTVTRHITDMSNYNAFAPALVDAMKWFNYKRIVKDEAGNMRLESVKGGIERMMGAAGKNYVINLLKAVNGIKNPQVASGFAGMVNSAIGKFKTSAVGANARVVLQQHASYVRGSALLSPAAMAAAYFRSPRRGMQMARKYSAIAAWKHMGYFDMNIGRQMSDLISGNESTAENVRQAAMKPAGLADDFTIGVLWNAAEIELGKTYKGDKRSEEFYKLVGEKLTEVIDRTQVVDTVFHRSQIMRDKDGLTKIATNFMSEPIKTYNLLMSAVKTGDLKTIARTGTVALLSYVVVAMAAGFSDAARDKDKEKGWQGYWESWMKNALGIGGNFFESNVWDNVNPLNMIPFGKDVYGLATGYSPSRPDLQAAQRMIWAANDWMDLFKGEDKDLYKLIYNTANAISTASGIPISNVMRDVKALYDTLDPRVMVGDGATLTYKRFADALVSGDEEKALAYYNALIDSGKDAGTIRTQVMNQYKENDAVKAAAEAKKAGDYAAYEKAIEQAVEDGIPREMAITAVKGMTAEPAVKAEPVRADTLDEVKAALDYKNVYTYTTADLMATIDRGDNAAAKKMIDKLLKEGRKKDTISGDITEYFKPKYLEAYKKGRASNLKSQLLTMYALLGYDRAKKSKDIDAWLKQ